VPGTFTIAYVTVTDGKIAALWTVFDQTRSPPSGAGLRRSDAGRTAMTCPPGRLALLHATLPRPGGGLPHWRRPAYLQPLNPSTGNL
jgi:hypothetical protein